MRFLYLVCEMCRFIIKLFYPEQMFTLDQIKETHAKVKSGADFPKYVQDMKALGVISYTQYVADGHTVYNGENHKVDLPSKYGPFTIAETADTEQLKYHLKIHQAGETDYLTFCEQVAANGVQKWIVDMQTLTCTYYDAAGNVMVAEQIPG
jgi:uncharacterized protein YbcV (DUF1398 family)